MLNLILSIHFLWVLVITIDAIDCFVIVEVMVAVNYAVSATVACVTSLRNGPAVRVIDDDAIV